MNLLDAILQANAMGNEALQPCDMLIGTVTGINPLKITVDTTQAELREEVLLLTEAVVEKKLSSLIHYHLWGGDPTDTALSGVTCYENGKALPTGTFVTLNRGLEKNDKVILLSVQHGQKFIVLSRVY